MILALALYLPALAEPGRTVVGVMAGPTEPAGLMLRASADYGLHRRLAVTVEGGAPITDLDPLRLGVGLMVSPVNSEWWRVGVAAMPELVVPLADGVQFADSRLDARAGLRVHWLVFWGIGLSGKLDGVLPLDEPQSPGWEWGGGLWVRL